MSESDGAVVAKTRENVEIEAMITRADGTVESLGTINAHYHNPFRQLAWITVRRPLSRRRIRAANRSASALRKAA